jgi:hypothetical protein
VPRYFFHLRDSGESLDHDGTVLSGPDEARAQAVVHSGELLRESGARFWISQEWRLWVTDETGATVCALRFTAE